MKRRRIMAEAIIGIFEDPSKARSAMDSLVEAGVDKGRISVMATEETVRDALVVEEQTKGAEGVAAGGGIGLASGAIIAGLTAVGAIASGGVGLMVAGPLVAALTGAGAGAVIGGAVGGLIGLGFSEHEVKHVQDALEKGSVVVAIETKQAEDEDTIKSILSDHDAKEISGS
jgi:hypothetical protein